MNAIGLTMSERSRLFPPCDSFPCSGLVDRPATDLQTLVGLSDLLGASLDSRAALAERQDNSLCDHFVRGSATPRRDPF